MILPNKPEAGCTYNHFGDGIVPRSLPCVGNILLKPPKQSESPVKGGGGLPKAIPDLSFPKMIFVQFLLDAGVINTLELQDRCVHFK